MKTIILALLFSLSILIAFSQTRHPNYGGGHHTESHGGHYSGGSGSSHRGGTYNNSRTYNTYGTHRSR